MIKNHVVDLGFSSSKTITDDGRQWRTLSVYQREAGSVLLGDDALNNPGGVVHLRTPQHLVEYYPQFVEASLNEAGIGFSDPSEQVKIAVGLPAQFWADQQAIGGGAIATLQQTLLSDRVAAVTVLPQGLGGIRSAAPAVGLILGIDIGFNTVISTLYSADRGTVVASNTMYKRGICQMITSHLAPKITIFTSGLAITPVELSRIVELGFVQAGFDQHDITPEICDAATEYSTALLEEILAEMRGSISVANPLTEVMFFGGGATYLAGINLQRENSVKVSVLPDPAFANARGFMSFLRG